MGATFFAKKFEETKLHGLVEGAKYQLCCRDCDRPLAIIWQTNPFFLLRDGTQYSYNYQAKCPFCGSCSDIKKINGEIRILEIVNEEPQEDGLIVERHITRFKDVQNFDDQELCLIYLSKP